MLNKFYFYVNPCLNPHQTLALEEYMLNHIAPDEMILYLYTHKDTVVIGKNQNAWAECRHEQLFADGGTLARRISGGGAVFHDIGNLNFSFIVGKEDYNLHRQLKVILNAVQSFGIDAAFSGRNDILANDRKFSGNAFCFRKDGAFHHGTILIHADMDKLSKYLAVPKDKIQSKGIASVRSRVVNLADLNPSVTNKRMAQALKDHFEAEYGPSQPYPLTDETSRAVDQIAQRNAQWEWLFGHSPKFDISIQNRFPWGGIELLFSLKDGIIEQAHIFSDAMDADLIEALPGALAHVPFQSAALSSAVRSLPHTPEQNEVVSTLAAFLESQSY